MTHSTCCPDGRTDFIIARPRLIRLHQTGIRIRQIIIVAVDHIPRYCTVQTHPQSIIHNGYQCHYLVKNMFSHLELQKPLSG